MNAPIQLRSPRREFFALLVAIAACAPPPRNVPPVVDLRVCVENEETAVLYRRYFMSAVAAESRGGAECDVTARGAALNAGKVTLRSAYDESVVAELEGPADLAPQLAALSLKRGTEGYRRVSAQRDAASSPR